MYIKNLHIRFVLKKTYRYKIYKKTKNKKLDDSPYTQENPIIELKKKKILIRGWKKEKVQPYKAVREVM